MFVAARDHHDDLLREFRLLALSGARPGSPPGRGPPAPAPASEALLAEAAELCRGGHLVSRPRTPVVRDFARWYLHEIVHQVAGGSPSRWTGPLDG